jgi:hypothetical protein
VILVLAWLEDNPNRKSPHVFFCQGPVAPAKLSTCPTKIEPSTHMEDNQTYYFRIADNPGTVPGLLKAQLPGLKSACAERQMNALISPCVVDYTTFSLSPI